MALSGATRIVVALAKKARLFMEMSDPSADLPPAFVRVQVCNTTRSATER